MCLRSKPLLVSLGVENTQIPQSKWLCLQVETAAAPEDYGGNDGDDEDDDYYYDDDDL